MPWPARLRGRVTLHAPRRFDHEVMLAPGHRWCPIAPAARVEVELGAHRWSGSGYLDSNRGDAPLETAFSRWDWSRAHLAGGDSLVFYDVEAAAGAEGVKGRAATGLQLGLRFGTDGRVEAIEPPPAHRLPATLWRVHRNARADADSAPRVRSTLTDAPFYARSLLDAQWLGEPVTVMHESLSLQRFDSPWVQAMLPFRMPRLAGRAR